MRSLKLSFFIILLFQLSIVEAKLLDKTIAVINDRIITLSLTSRVQSNLNARRNISPVIYPKSKYSRKEIIDILIQREMVRSKLNEIGYVIGDDQVESQIKSTEQRLGLNRRALLNFLKNNNFTYDEYFELIRETIEFNIFTSRIIRPLVSVTEQEIKNTFYKNNLKNKTLNFKYTLVDFSLPSKSVTSAMKKNFKSVLKDFQTRGTLPEKFKNIDTSTLGDISEEDLSGSLRKVLKRTDEGSFSSPISYGGSVHVFFVKKKDLVESSIYLQNKTKIRNVLFEKSAKKLIKVWFKRDENNHYIKYFI